jgi:GNAT superfamily N-acetyltransferase
VSDPGSLDIRPARGEDLSQLSRLLAQLATEETHAGAYEIDEPTAAETLRAIERQTGHTLLVALDGAVVIGTLDLIVVPNLTHGSMPWAMVENMVVDERHRRRGIGRALLKEAVSRAREAGCYKVQLLSRRERGEAHRFHEALGFEGSATGFRLYLGK